MDISRVDLDSVGGKSATQNSCSSITARITSYPPLRPLPARTRPRRCRHRPERPSGERARCGFASAPQSPARARRGSGGSDRATGCPWHRPYQAPRVRGIGIGIRIGLGLGRGRGLGLGLGGFGDTGYPHATKLSRGACLRTKVRSHGSPMILVRTGGCACDERYCEYTAQE